MIDDIDNKAILTVIDSVFEPERASRHTVEIQFGRTVAEVLPERVKPDGSWVVVEGGRVLSPEEWQARLITPGVEIVCYPVMNNDVARIAIGAVLVIAAVVAAQPELALIGFNTALFIGSVGAGLAVGGLQGLLMGPPKLAVTPSLTSDGGGSPTYGFGGITNGTRIGAPIPVVYGQHRAYLPVEALTLSYVWMEHSTEMPEDQPIEETYEPTEAAA